MAVKRFVSWNVNGIRACLGKDFYESFASLNADILCLQETKMQEGQAELLLDGYHQYWNYAEKKGYSGTTLPALRAQISVSAWVLPAPTLQRMLPIWCLLTITLQQSFRQ